MYCVNCGVLLDDAVIHCPLCGTKAYHPEPSPAAPPSLYPPAQYPQMPAPRHTAGIIATGAHLLPMLVCALCDRQLNGITTWSGYVTGGLILNYIATVLPLWFRKPKLPVITILFSLAAAMFLRYIELHTGGSWFLSLALPVDVYLTAMVIAITALSPYAWIRLYLWGGASLATGLLAVLTEWRITVTFGLPEFTGWSLYPLAVFGVLAATLIFLGLCRPARQTMARKFFI